VSSAIHVSVTGVVQGVGFRPFLHRLAERHGLSGWVRNEAGEVRIVAEGSADGLRAFVAAIETEAPPLARIDRLDVRDGSPGGHAGFRIIASADQPDRRQPVSPDVAVCPDCERELYDPADRRHRYPFITCTNCGPRFTVIEAMPYDRERTSMRVFAQCDECLAEYRAPADRRYHSESNSCPRCGPKVWAEQAGGLASERADGDAVDGMHLRDGTDVEHRPVSEPDASGVPEPLRTDAAAMRAAAEALLDGRIVAIRGLGGFHLAVDATNEHAVARLRARKSREAKPLAVMVPTVRDAEAMGAVGSVERQLLTSAERPIVLLRRHETSGLAASVAPGLDSVGVMTAYTPLHRLLLDLVGRPLVMTSGNLSEEPIATDNDDARVRLSGVADLLLLHDREIVARYDDSVVRPTGHGPVFLRRARGYAPLPLRLPVAAPVPLVAVGPHLKNTFTIVHGATAYVSQHIGDLENLETLEHFRDSLTMFQRLFRVTPKAVARDLHPGYLSTRVAKELDLGEPIAVQHHHAHVAAVAAEHGVTDRVVGIAYDGTGYGDDGAVWGAEILVADLARYERRCRLRYVPLAGGDLAARQPWRVALGYLSLAPGAADAFRAAFEHVRGDELDLARQQIERKLNAPPASSMGRLFDAAAAVLGTRHLGQYEGQAAMELECLAGRHQGGELPFPLIERGDGTLELDPVPLLVALGERRAAGNLLSELAAAFHDAVVRATVEAACRVAAETGIDQVALGGGVFQNARLLDGVAGGLSAAGCRVLVPRALSPNDGAISFGQAAVAATLLQRT
jgi:hydrogenase maturation protein HypF